MSTDAKWYVYTLIDPRTHEVFYVGKGQKYRMYSHYYAVKNGNIPNKNNYSLFRKIKSIIDSGSQIIYKKVYTTSDEDDAYLHEHQLINKIGIENLCNIFEGRAGVHSGERHWNYGKKWSDDVKQKIANSRRGKPHTDEFKKQLSERVSGVNHPLYGVGHTPATRAKMSENHADFTGKNNPFYGKTHSKETKEYFKKLYSSQWVITKPDGERISCLGKKEVLEYIKAYNEMYDENVSAYSMFQYGKNGHGWTVEKMQNT